MEENMIDIQDVINSITGLYPNGEKKAICALEHQLVFRTGNNEPEIDTVDNTTTFYAEAALAVSNDSLVTVSLRFDDFDASDYIEFKAVCDNYFNQEASDVNRSPVLVLTMTDQATTSNYISMAVSLFVCDGKEPVIRFFGSADNTSVTVEEYEDEE